MALSSELMLQSPDTASLATDWIWEWHVTFPDTIQWWQGRIFKVGGGKNHCLFSPWTASVILCSCIIFVMPRSPLWNNMLLRLACFQTSYLLKLESLRWGGRDFCSLEWDSPQWRTAYCWAPKSETTVVIVTTSIWTVEVWCVARLDTWPGEAQAGLDLITL